MTTLWIEPTAETADRVTLRLAGRLADDDLRVLEDECRRGREAGKRVTLDLSGLTFVGRTGVETLRRLRDRGLELVHVPPLIADLL